MAKVSTHPSAQMLALFGNGKLPAAHAAAVADHLETCADCRRTVASLPPDSFLGKIQAARPDGTVLPPGPAVPDAVRGAVAGPDAPVPDLPPELTDHPKFRILRELGRGGMGVIYLAEHRVLEKSVALKVISPAVLDNPSALARFHAEARAAAKLDHQNIARAHDADQAGDLHFLVMEYVEGVSLAQLLQKKGPLSVASACHCVCQAALGLQHAFEKGMAHRDIKPQNLMLTPKGQVKVLDFGLARLRGPQAVGQGLTQADAFMGTPEYVSPEQATDARTADIRSDVYSLGCTLYALLTGQPPFAGDTLVKLVMAHIEKEPPPLHELRPDVPAEVSAVAVKMLAKDPAKRYQRPVEVAQALAPFAKGGAKTRGAGAAPPAGKSAGTGTVVGGDTSRVVGAGEKAPKLTANKPPAGEPVSSGESERTRHPPAPVLVKKLKRPRKAPAPAPWWKRPAVLVGTGLAALALLLLAGIIVKVKLAATRDDAGNATASPGDTGKPRQPPEGALVLLEVDQPGAEVLVDGGKILLSIPGDKKPVEIRLAPGKPHTLEVKRDGFATYAQGDLELKAGESKPIKVSLRPLPPAGPARFPIAKGVEQPAFGAWEISNGELVQPRWVWGARLLFGDKTWTDYDFTVDAQMTDRNCGFGLMVRNNGLKPTVNPQDNTIRHKDLLIFVVGAYGNTSHGLSQVTDGKGGELANKGLGPDQRLKKGQWYTARARVRGDHIQCFLKSGNQAEEKIFDAFTTAPPAGLVGLMTWDAPFKFRNIKVTDPTGKVLLEGLPDLDNQGAKPASGGTTGFVPLFNGKDKTGWKTHPSQPGNWYVTKDGVLMSSGPISHLYTERGDYKDFHLRVEARVNDGGNSGLIARAPFGPAWPASNPRFLGGYEAQIDCTRAPATGSLYAGADGAVVSLKESPVPANQWFTEEVIARGNHIIVKVNGKTTADFTDEKRRFTSGHIALQQHGAQTVAEFRTIEIKELK